MILMLVSGYGRGNIRRDIHLFLNIVTDLSEISK